MYIQIQKLRIYPAIVTLMSMFGSVVSPVYAVEQPFDAAQGKPREQMFVVTAYYSPLPNQCCYFRGNYEDEIIFNGNGTNGADGTAVYPGMIAAPDTYPFGTVIELPGFGIGTVHDRGSRIIEWDDGAHRIDLWMGAGEEGLARALVWGTRTVKGIVHTAGNVPLEDWSLSRFESNPAVLGWLPKSDPVVSIAKVSFNDRSYSVRMLQKSLIALGYLHDKATGSFGEGTKAALAKFLKDYGLPGDGSEVGQLAAAALSIAQEIKENNLPEVEIAEAGQSGSDVRQIQKLLRYLGHYQGRTDGVFDEELKKNVLSFQMQAGVVSSPDASGAGRVGPATRTAILKAWKVKIVAMRAKALAEKQKFLEEIASAIPKKSLSRGDRGDDVRRLQSLLSDLSYLSKSDVTGMFGERTEVAVLKYQMEKKIVSEESERGAGIFGPATKVAISQDAATKGWQKMRSGAL